MFVGQATEREVLALSVSAVQVSLVTVATLPTRKNTPVNPYAATPTLKLMMQAHRRTALPEAKFVATDDIALSRFQQSWSQFPMRLDRAAEYRLLISLMSS